MDPDGLENETEHYVIDHYNKLNTNKSDKIEDTEFDKVRTATIKRELYMQNLIYRFQQATAKGERELFIEQLKNAGYDEKTIFEIVSSSDEIVPKSVR